MAGVWKGLAMDGAGATGAFGGVFLHLAEMRWFF